MATDARRAPLDRALGGGGRYVSLLDHTSSQQRQSAPERVLVTGASGFLGGELLRRLAPDATVRAMVRDAEGFSPPPGSDPQVVQADVLDPGALGDALSGVREAYYLVHSMESGGGDFAERDRRAAENYAAAARTAGVRRTIYMGGIGSSQAKSAHLRSRHQVEDVLEQASPEFVAIRASMIVGAGSAAFRALVDLVDRLPVLLLPSWRERRTQPIAVADVVSCLLGARDVSPGRYEVGGPEAISFEAMTEVIAEIRGKTHRALPLPFSNARAEGLLSSVVSDQRADLLIPLMEGLHDDLLVDKNAVRNVFGVQPLTFREAATEALT